MKANTVIHAAAIILIAANAAHGQSGSLTGVVHRDTQRAPASGVLVRLPELNRETRADSAGAFRLAPLPAGIWIVTIRGPGLQPVRDSIVISEGRETKREFVLDQLPQVLDSVIARAERPGLTPGMRQLELRRSTGMGHFLTGEALENVEHRSLPSVLARWSGVNQVNYKGYTFLATGRGTETRGLGAASGSGGWPRAIVADSRSPRRCWATIFVDGARIYDITSRGDVPDLRAYDLRQLDGIEYYRGPAETPAELNTLNSPCGTLVLWTRTGPTRP